MAQTGSMQLDSLQGINMYCIKIYNSTECLIKLYMVDNYKLAINMAETAYFLGGKSIVSDWQGFIVIKL